MKDTDLVVFLEQCCVFVSDCKIPNEARSVAMLAMITKVLEDIEPAVLRRIICNYITKGE